MAADKTEMVKGIIDIPRDQLQLLLESSMYLTENQEFSEAMTILDGVCQLAPHSEVPIILLGITYAAQQNFRRAIKEYERALKLNPKNGLAQIHIGEALLFEKKRDEAMEALDKGIALDPKGPGVELANSLKELAKNEVFDK